MTTPCPDCGYDRPCICDKYRARIEELRHAICDAVLEMDKVMKGPSTFERGQTIAHIVSKLQRAAELERTNEEKR